MGTATNTETVLDPAELAEATTRTSKHARGSGALVPLDTCVRTMVSGGISFVVRVSDDVQRKQPPTNPGATPGDPFSPPYEDDLFVGHVSRTHVALLNKFNVLDDHLLIVTRDWAEQAEMLTRADYEALLLGLAGMDGLAFYNGGAEAGASQPHKHLQVAPLPLADTVSGLPFDGALSRCQWRGEIGRSAEFPFAHRVTRIQPDWLRDPEGEAATLQAAVEALWRDLGFDPRVDRQPAPYNLLATRQWLWLVPRVTAGWRGLPVNALGYAGALIAQDEAAFERLAAMGPMALLADCALPATEPAPR
jgi:ATP adenylyltransferase